MTSRDAETPSAPPQALCPACGTAASGDAGASAPAPCPACGAELRLRQRYVLRSVLGANVGTTYLADDLRAGTNVVVKELQFARLDAWKTEELFAREAQVLKQLDHPRIPRYLDAFSEGHGKQLRSYLVQQHLDGRDLRSELAERRYSEADVLEILDQVLEILEYLQRLAPPIVHRDLKPSNLMRLRATNAIALIDFGSVRDLVAPAGSQATVAGTFGFMAPEQFQGDAFLQTDLYGLGAVAVQLLSRVAPDKMLASGTHLAWQPHVRASAPVRNLLERLLAAEPKDRPADATAARALVRQTRRDLDRPASPPDEHAKPSARRDTSRAPVPPAALSRRALPFVMASLALALTAGAGVFFVVRSTSPTPDGDTRAPAPPTRRAQPPQPVPAPIRPPNVTPARTPFTTLARELPAGEMRALLSASSWSGTLNGTVTFTSTASGLQATLRTPSGEVRPFERVALGPLATVTLTLVHREGALTTTDTFHGALSADRRTLHGSHERRLREGAHESREDDRTWHVTAVDAQPGGRLPPR